MQQPFAFNEVVHVTDLEALNNDIRKIDPVKVTGTCFMQGDQIIFSFDINGQVILPCARTLVDVPYALQLHATELFTTSAHVDDMDKDDDVHFINGEVLDLMPLIKENILLDIPYRVFSKDVKNHEQVVKGKGWAVVSEQMNQKKNKDEKETIDPRLQKLSLLLDNQKGE